jgi:hypothetical protein
VRADAVVFTVPVTVAESAGIHSEAAYRTGRRPVSHRHEIVPNRGTETTLAPPRLVGRPSRGPAPTTPFRCWRSSFRAAGTLRASSLQPRTAAARSSAATLVARRGRTGKRYESGRPDGP